MWIERHAETLTRWEDMLALCAPEGIEPGHWPLDGLKEAVCREAFQNPDYSQQVLQTVAEPLAQLKEKYGYVTEDIVALSPQTPNLDTILAQFDKEHHHTDDEVRVVLYGEGIFGFVPPAGEPFAIHVEAGDLLVVPAYTRHWFKLTESKIIVALRIFKDSSGWTALYDKDPERHRASAGSSASR